MVLHLERDPRWRRVQRNSLAASFSIADHTVPNHKQHAGCVYCGAFITGRGTSAVVPHFAACSKVPAAVMRQLDAYVLSRAARMVGKYGTNPNYQAIVVVNAYSARCRGCNTIIRNVSSTVKAHVYTCRHARVLANPAAEIRRVHVEVPQALLDALDDPAAVAASVDAARACGRTAKEAFLAKLRSKAAGEAATQAAAQAAATSAGDGGGDGGGGSGPGGGNKSGGGDGDGEAGDGGGGDGGSEADSALDVPLDVMKLYERGKHKSRVCIYCNRSRQSRSRPILLRHLATCPGAPADVIARVHREFVLSGRALQATEPLYRAFDPTKFDHWRCRGCGVELLAASMTALNHHVKACAPCAAMVKPGHPGVRVVVRGYLKRKRRRGGGHGGGAAAAAGDGDGDGNGNTQPRLSQWRRGNSHDDGNGSGGNGGSAGGGDDVVLTAEPAPLPSEAGGGSERGGSV